MTVIKASNLIKATDSELLANYIVWRVVQASVRLLDERFENIKQVCFVFSVEVSRTNSGAFLIREGVNISMERKKKLLATQYRASGSFFAPPSVTELLLPSQNFLALFFGHGKGSIGNILGCQIISYFS